METSQEDYPSPNELDDKGRKKYKGYEEMLPDYTFACGGSAAIAKIISFLDSQGEVVDEIKARQAAAAEDEEESAI